MSQETFNCPWFDDLADTYPENQRDEEPIVPYGTIYMGNNVIVSDVRNIRQVLTNRVNFYGLQIGSRLRNERGLLIMPLHAVSLIRVPTGHHIVNPTVILWHPLNSIDNYSYLPQFQECVEILYDYKRH